MNMITKILKKLIYLLEDSSNQIDEKELLIFSQYFDSGDNAWKWHLED